MKCPNCNFDNPESIKFCVSCGAMIYRICPSCGFSNPGQFNFCGNCGDPLKNSQKSTESKKRMPSYLAEKIQQVGSHIVGERRNVTVVFSDISGFTKFSEMRDPEEVAAIANICHNAMGRVIYEYDGVVDKIVGDGLMAIFGIPTRENDPERAVLAAIEIQQVMEKLFQEMEKAMGITFGLSIGINTGVVVIGDLGNDMLMDYTVIGDVVNTASRVEGKAEAGEILVTYETYQRTSHCFDYQPLEPVNLKGKSQPVKLYKVISQKERPLNARGIKGLSSPIIGRDKELAISKKMVDNLIAGNGGILAIKGEAGLGKSRLVAEIVEYTKSYHITRINGKCFPYSRSINYWVFIDALKGYFQIESNDNTEVIIEKIMNRTGNENIAESTVSIIGSLISPKFKTEGIADSKDELDKKLRIFSAISDVLRSSSRSNPLLLVLDDLHWADDLSIELLLFLVENLSDSEIIFVFVYRPSMPDEHDNNSIQKIEGYLQNSGDSTLITLSPLSNDASSVLLGSLLSTEELPSEIKELILSKASGNPFYLEELIRSIIDDKAIEQRDGKWLAVKKIEDIQVPSNIQDVIIARIDRLDEESKNILYSASVIGRAFDYDAILYLFTGGIESVTPNISQNNLNDLLGELPQTLLKFQKTRSIHRVYGQILDKHLEKLEGMGFISYEESNIHGFKFRHTLIHDVAYNSILIKRRRQLHEMVGKYIEEIHSDGLEEFYELLAYHYDNSNNKEAAISYTINAGEKSIKSFTGSAQSALQYFIKAEDILISPSLENDGKTIYKQRIYNGKGEVYNDLGQFEEALASFEVVLTIAGEKKDFPLKAKALRQIGNNKTQIGNWNDGLKAYNESLSIVRDLGDLPQMGFVYNAIGYGYFVKGEYDEAMKYFQEALRIGKQCSDLPLIGDASNCLGMLASVKLDLDEAIQHYQDSLKSYKELKESHYEAQAYQNLGIAHFKKGELSIADKYYDDSLKISEKCGYIRLKAYTYLNKAELYLSLSDPENATIFCELAYQILHTLNDDIALAECHKLYGKIYRCQKNLPSAKTAFLTSLKISAECDNLANIAEVHYEMGLMYNEEGILNESLEHLEESRKIFEELGIIEEAQKVNIYIQKITSSN
jgi:predicted ATPase/class 3 adenylate cyclase